MLNVKLNDKELEQIRNLAAGYHGATLRRYLDKLLQSFDIAEMTPDNLEGFKIAKRIIQEDILDLLDNVIKAYADTEQGGEYE